MNMKANATTATIRELLPAINKLEDQDMAEKIAQIWLELYQQSAWDDLRDVWLDPTIPEKVCLVDHVNCICEMVVQMNEIISKYHPEKRCDNQLLLQLTLMHDVSKIVEFQPSGDKCEFSHLAFMYQHAMIGAYMAKKYGLPDHLVHLIYSHADKSTTKPLYREGALFHNADHGHFDTVLFR